MQMLSAVSKGVHILLLHLAAPQDRGRGGAPLLLLPLVMTPVIGIRMEYVGGGTLQDMVEHRVELLQQQPGIKGQGKEGKEGGEGEGALNHRLIHRLLTEMFSALDYLHTVAHLLHRDIKSDNIFVTAAPFGRHIKVRHSSHRIHAV